mgnify:CR=1 FL=1
MFQSEVQPFVDAEDDFLSVVSSSSLAMTLTIGLALKVPVADPTTQWMLNWIAIIISCFVFLLATYQAIVDAYDTCCRRMQTAQAIVGTNQVAAEPEEASTEDDGYDAVFPRPQDKEADGAVGPRRLPKIAF